MNPMLRSLTYEQLLTYYNNMVSPKKGTKRLSGSKRAGLSAMQDAYMEIVARVQKAQADQDCIEVGMRVMVTPASLTLDFRVPMEAIILKIDKYPTIKTQAIIRFLDGTTNCLCIDRCRAVMPEGVTQLGRR